MTDLTPAQVKAIADEIETLNRQYYPHRCGHIAWITHLNELHPDCYDVAYWTGPNYTDIDKAVLWRIQGKLLPAIGVSYFPPGWTTETRTEQEAMQQRQPEGEDAHG